MSRRALASAALLALAGSAATAQVITSGSSEAKPGPAANFTGRVTVRTLTSPTVPGRTGTSMVSFSRGARTNWHVHPAGQTLYVTSGCGWVQADGGPVRRICAGDAVYAAPGTRH